MLSDVCGLTAGEGHQPGPRRTSARGHTGHVSLSRAPSLDIQSYTRRAFGYQSKTGDAFVQVYLATNSDPIHQALEPVLLAPSLADRTVQDLLQAACLAATQARFALFAERLGQVIDLRQLLALGRGLHADFQALRAQHGGPGSKPFDRESRRRRIPVRYRTTAAPAETYPANVRA